MALPVIAGTVRCAVNGTVPSGRKWVNVVHCRYAGGASAPGVTEITALHAKLQRLYSGTSYAAGFPWFSNCYNTVKSTSITYYPLDGTGTPLDLAFVAAGGGTPTAATPSEVAICATVHTATRGRRYRGRMFLPVPKADQFDANGNLVAAPATSFGVQFAGLQTDLASIQWEFGIASYGQSWVRGPHNRHGAATLVTWAPFFTKATTVTVDPRPDVIRHRKG